MKEQIFSIYKSRKPYTQKPSGEESKNMNFQRETIIREVAEGKREAYETSLNQIGKFLEQGYSINASILKTTRLLILDIDNTVTEKEFSEVCKKWNIIPNIYYRTFSHVQGTNERFRAIYKLDREYNLEEYKEIYQMFLFLFGEMDTTSSNFKQLCHGTDKKVKVIHGNSLDVKDLAKRCGYLEHLEELKQQKEQEERERAEKRKHHTPKATGNNRSYEDNIESVLAFYRIRESEWNYPEGLNIYLSLREFDVDVELNLISSEANCDFDKRLKKYEKAFLEGMKPERGSVGASLYGALKSLEERRERGEI